MNQQTLSCILTSVSLDDILTIISLIIAFLSACVSFYAIHQARKTALTGTYFSEMAHAYSDYLRRVSEFTFRRGAPERDALTAALYRLQLFASPETSSDAQHLYTFLIDWASSNPSSALSLDEKVNSLGSKMRNHLNKARKRGRL